MYTYCIIFFYYLSKYYLFIGDAYVADCEVKPLRQDFVSDILEQLGLKENKTRISVHGNITLTK